VTSGKQDPWSVDKDGDRLTVSLLGEVDEEAIAALDRELRSQLARAASKSYEILFDLGGVRRCSAGARSAIAKLQEYIREIARRTAYVANRPAFRGLALWVCHIARDGNARTFPSLVEANIWLASAEDREDSLRDRAVTWIERVRNLPRKTSK